MGIKTSCIYQKIYGQIRQNIGVVQDSDELLMVASETICLPSTLNINFAGACYQLN
jgi:hypothetical protein